MLLLGSTIARHLHLTCTAWFESLFIGAVLVFHVFSVLFLSRIFFLVFFFLCMLISFLSCFVFSLVLFSPARVMHKSSSMDFGTRVGSLRSLSKLNHAVHTVMLYVILNTRPTFARARIAWVDTPLAKNANDGAVSLYFILDVALPRGPPRKVRVRRQLSVYLGPYFYVNFPYIVG